MDKLFIDENVNVFTGKEAENLISEKNDKKYLKDGTILRVDKERWSEAQFYERKTWMENAINLADDRNYEHFDRFNSYSSLNELNIFDKKNNIIELGCGPFTNLRTFIKKFTNLNEVHLLDPLLNDYLNHLHCSYKNSNLGEHKLTCHSTSIEEFESGKKFDLVLMNNVLEHCFDIPLIFEKIIGMLKEDGIFIFSDVYFSEESISKNLDLIYDAGHPIRVSKKALDNFLSKFEIIYERDFEGLYGQPWRNDKYFIGKLKK